MVLREKETIVSDIVCAKPEGLLNPCTCGKCVHKNECHFMVDGINCCKYCKNKGGDSPQNVYSSNVLEDEDVIGSNISDTRGVFFFIFAVNKNFGTHPNIFLGIILP